MIPLILALIATVTLAYHAAVSAACAFYTGSDESPILMRLIMFVLPLCHIIVFWVLYAHTA